MIIQVGKISKDIEQMAAKLAKKLKDELIVSSDPKATALWQEKVLEHHVVLLADLNNQPSEKDFSLLTAANEKGASLLLANAKQDIVTKISGVGTDAKFVIDELLTVTSLNGEFLSLQRGNLLPSSSMPGNRSRDFLSTIEDASS